MNGNTEAVETAIKTFAATGSTKIKGIEDNKAVIIVCDGNFHGRTTTIISFSSDPAAKKNFGAFTPGFVSIPYNDTNALAEALADKNAAGFLIEPIQGEAGVLIPDEGYLAKAKQLCEEANVLFIGDEIQTGLAELVRCWLNVTAMCIRRYSWQSLGSNIIAGSAVLTDDEIMLTINQENMALRMVVIHWHAK